MSDCAACDGQGGLHTCGRSGLPYADAIREEFAVEPVERVPVHTVTLTVVCHCSHDQAIGLAKALEYRAGEPSYTTVIAYAVSEHANLSEEVAA
jgi:hypothetical protein